MKAVAWRMGILIRSENSLNQHIKNKHKELWETVKARYENLDEKQPSLKENSLHMADRKDNKRAKSGNDGNSVDFENND